MDITVVALVVVVVLIVAYVLQSGPATKVPIKSTPKLTGPFSAKEVAKHNTEDDAWIIIDGKVYDVTDYISDHPGGDAIMNNLGGDNTKGFKADHHPPTVWEVIPMYYIGDLKKTQ